MRENRTSGTVRGALGNRRSYREIRREKARASEKIRAMTYTYIWEYIVKENALDAFEQAYKPDGSWTRLFKQADGYLATELHRDLEYPRRFVTVDYWTSQSAHEAFMAHYGEQYQALDASCAGLTESERLLGRFLRWS